MTSYSNGGFFNPAYHDSETLEIDRRAPIKTHHTNPYSREGRGWMQPEVTSVDDGVEGAPVGHWQQESRRGDGGGFPMSVMSTPSNPSWQQGHSKMTMRWRGMTVRRIGMFPNADPTNAVFTEDAIRDEMENEEQTLVKDLVALSTRERIRSIRNLPMSFEEKKHIRTEVLAFQSAKKSRHFTCLADCSENVSLSIRRCGYGVKSARQTLQLWQGTMKEIGGKFGSSVLTYFLFLKWLLIFNIFSFLVNFGFITIPLLFDDPLPSIPPGVSFRGLEIITGAGYFNYTVMYYGGYSNETLVGVVDYNMQLAYFFTIAFYMVLCGIALIFSMASLFKKNYVLADSASSSAWQLLCSWDFSVTNEKAVKKRKNNIRIQLKESLSEKTQQELLTLPERLKHFGVHVGSWLLSTTLAVGCGASIYYLCEYEQKRTTDTAGWSLLQEAETLLVPFVVSLMNLVIPLFYSLFNEFEHYTNHRRQIYALVIRNVFLKMVILAVLCYYWMNVVAEDFWCWETMVGQALYRLVIFDFLFLMLGSFFGEFLWSVIGTRLIPRLGVPEFDVARNVLELIYAQTLGWIGIYFSPLLPAIQILKFFTLFFLKKVSLIQNCQPPRRSGRAAQMQTIFVFLLWFPFYVGALSMVAYTAWRLTPSAHCGPFRGLNNTFSVVEEWMHDLDAIPGSQWVIWIYRNVIRSEVFYFLISLIILVVTYLFWQVSQGRKHLIDHLKQQIVNEGKDKSFLLEKLQSLQKNRNPTSKAVNQKAITKERSDRLPTGSHSNAMVQALLARQQMEEEEDQYSSVGRAVHSDTSSSGALRQAMQARQRAMSQSGDYGGVSSFNTTQTTRQGSEGNWRDRDYSPASPSSAITMAMQARQRAERNEEDDDDLPSSISSAMRQVMLARQRAEESDPSPSQSSAPPGSSALIQAMWARQQAQNEYDDGY